MKYKNVLIIYGSTTCNSENLSFFCEDIIKKNQINCSVLNVQDIKNLFEFNNKVDLYILCVSTWGIEPAVLQEDFDLFWNNKVSKISIVDKKFAILGLGDNYYPHFAYATEILTKSILQYHGLIIYDALKIQDPWEENKPTIQEYLNHLLGL